jgi:hypothetical protein
LIHVITPCYHLLSFLLFCVSFKPVRLSSISSHQKELLQFKQGCLLSRKIAQSKVVIATPSHAR